MMMGIGMKIIIVGVVAEDNTAAPTKGIAFRCNYQRHPAERLGADRCIDITWPLATRPQIWN